MFAKLARCRRPVMAHALVLTVLGSLSDAQTIRPGGSGQSVRSRPLGSAEPPRITTDLRGGATALVGQELRFRVTATDRNRDKVTLRLLNPESGLVFHPLLESPSGTASEVRWIVGEASGGLRELVFEAHDDAKPTERTRLRVQIRVLGDAREQVLLEGDVTGDGVMDVIVGEPRAEVGGVQQTGAIFVFAGGGSHTGQVAPHATLTVPGAVELDRLGQSRQHGQGIHLEDVTGDGVLDVVAIAPFADAHGMVDAGAVYVFPGGPGLSGSVGPKATLRLPGTGNSLPFGSGLVVQMIDMTGDGVSDVVATAEFADVGGISDAGAVLVFAGGPGLSGDVAPTATLSVPEAQPGDLLGGGNGLAWLQGVLIADVTNDGAPDVVALAPKAGYCDSPNTGDTVCDAGAIYVFAGGPGMVGAVAPVATLRASDPSEADRLGFVNGDGVHLADVTGDGLLDVVAGAMHADLGGIEDVGGIYVFAGDGGFSGSVLPRAVLSVPDAFAGDRLGFGGNQRRGIQIADLSGDGVLDIVAAAVSADVNGVQDTGAVYVFVGGGRLSGSVSPSATMYVPRAGAGDRLGDGLNALQLADVTGDGLLDVVAGSRTADAGGVVDAGAIFVFGGRSRRGGRMFPSATLRVPDASEGDQLGDTAQGFYEPDINVVDMNADGVMDLVVGASRADVDGVTDAGAIYVFLAGEGLSGESFPTARLSVPGAAAGDRLGSGKAGIHFADVTGDGSLDVVAKAESADVGGVTDAGAFYVFSGSPGFSGSVPPVATLAVPGALAGDRLGSSLNGFPGRRVRLADVTADGVLDVVATATSADVGGIEDAGAIYVFAGGAGMSGLVAPATLSVPDANHHDRLGDLQEEGLRIADVTGDGKQDILGGSARATSIYVWPGPTTSSAPTARFAYSFYVP